jgi:hypothetical protein
LVNLERVFKIGVVVFANQRGSPTFFSF